MHSWSICLCLCPFCYPPNCSSVTNNWKEKRVSLHLQCNAMKIRNRLLATGILYLSKLLDWIGLEQPRSSEHSWGIWEAVRNYWHRLHGQLSLSSNQPKLACCEEVNRLGVEWENDFSPIISYMELSDKTLKSDPIRLLFRRSSLQKVLFHAQYNKSLLSSSFLLPNKKKSFNNHNQSSNPKKYWAQKKTLSFGSMGKVKMEIFQSS